MHCANRPSGGSDLPTSPFLVVLCSSARASSSGKPNFGFVASTKGNIPLGRPSSMGSPCFSACSITLVAWSRMVRMVMLTLLVRWMVRTSPVLFTVTFLQRRSSVLVAKFDESDGSIKSNNEEVLNVGMTTTLGFGAKPHFRSQHGPTLQRATSGPDTSGGAAGRRAIVKTTPTPCPATVRAALRSFCSASLRCASRGQLVSANVHHSVAELKRRWVGTQRTSWSRLARIFA